MERNERRQEMLAKVRKLLAMGRDGRGNEFEEEAAMRQANKIMAAYGIAEAEVDMAAIDAGEMIFGETKCGPDGRAPEQGRVYRQMPSYAAVLSVGVARFCDAIVSRIRNEYGDLLVFKGEKEDVLLARWIFGVLVDSILAEQKKSGWTGRKEATEFRDAAAGKLQRRLIDLAHEREAMYAQAKVESNSRALVVVDRKKTEIATRFGIQRLKSSARRYSVSGAYYAGQEAGSRINIPSGQPLSGSSNKRITA